MFPSFEIFGRTVGLYGICTAAGMAAAVLCGVLLSKKRGFEPEDILLVMLSCGCGLFLGGHLMYGITQAKAIAALFLSASSYSFREFIIALFGSCFGGMVYYGGFLGALAGLAVHCRFSKYVTFKGMADIFAVCVPLFHTFGRIGCFLGGCCYGIESSWGFITYTNEYNPSINGVTRFPVQLFEAGCNLVIFLVLLLLYRKDRMKNRLVFLYMILYPVCRFILEFFRGDEIRGFIFAVSTSQFISILLFSAAVIILVILKIRKSRGKRRAQGS